MADEPLPTANVPSLEDWPQLIAGPMLRRVTRTTISVFLAFKRTTSARLMLFGPEEGSDDFVSSLHTTVSLGANLHVLVLTLTLPEGRQLKPNTWYAYDLESTDPEGTVSVLSTTNPELGYVDSRGVSRPGFYAPPADATSLRIIHASCRLPHGDDPDALPGLDDLLKARFADDGSYPHHLIFHGDQIYADDVAPAMLNMAQVIGELALGWPELEKIPSRYGEFTNNSKELRPTIRGQLLHKDGCFTSTDAGCHLVTFSEFVGMYLLVWSPVLWPRVGTTIAVPSQEMVLPAIDWPGYELLELLIPDFAFTFDRELAVKAYAESTSKILRFGRELTRVRRALANIPTLMCFDDHEVTDDWMLNRTWQRRLSESTLAQRIVANALSAHAIFQHWGNVPEQFAEGSTGAKLLAGLSLWPVALVVNDSAAPPLAISEALGMPRLLGAEDSDSVNWHFRADYGTYEIAFLDTRTRRGFSASETGPTALLSAGAMAQVPAAVESKMSVTVSPAPLLGHWLVEDIIQQIFTVIFVGAPLGGRAGGDYEAWAFEENAFNEIMRRLFVHGQAYVLSGDVHFSAFAVAARLTNDARRQEILQFIASPLCNRMYKPRALAIGSSLDQLSNSQTVWAVAKLVGMLGSIPVLGPAIAQLPVALLETLTWLKDREDFDENGYVISLVADSRPTFMRRLMAGALTLDPLPIDDSRRAVQTDAAADDKLGRGQLDVSRTVVGRSSFCELRFEEGRVVHQVYFDPVDGSAYVPRPYTRVAWDL